ncbi:hypothetical protein LCGC14_0056130 [marine sediment metagenome]|uniref:Uncharacterized protein n=1 Tax=marine sediment metagenome TaxID=412755 RepID=A0A0F9VRB9_9ZZZZ|nr:hypothetical protein [Halomonas sp.]HDZ46227.1 hypothetical protein [Halomonas sp.]HEB04248.1 hypothetical protein [Halomonas sp.]
MFVPHNLVTTRYVAVGFVARGKPTAHPRKQREAVPGLACAGVVGAVPLGVVPPPPAGASAVRSSQPRYHALRGRSFRSAW